MRPGYPCEISTCGRYRYTLWRMLLGDTSRFLLFVMLNPSTANAEDDDPTIRRCIGFAAREGYGALAVVNLFAWRATDAGELKRAVDPVGPDNDGWISALAAEAGQIVVAWGARAKIPRGFQGRDRQVLRMLPREKVTALAVLKDGAPSHPLFLPSDAALAVYP